MKKTTILFGLFALLLFSASSVSAVKVSQGQQNTIINGHVYVQGGHVPVYDEEVIATCNSRMAVDYTNTEGFYAMSIVRGCPAGSTVTACIQDGTNCRTGTVMNIQGYLIAYINLQCVVDENGSCV